MQRVPALVSLLLSLLYLAALTPANATTQDEPSSTPQESVPHIAVLLPTKSGPFTRAADAVRRGVLEAQRVQNEPDLPLVVYETTDDPFDVVKVYREAVAGQARFVIGPLTRSAVSALANSLALPVPTLALNAPEADTVLPDGMFVFGMQVEHEARQVAALAHQRGFRRAMVVRAPSSLSQRLAQSFAQEWSAGGGEIVREEEISSDPALLATLRDAAASAAPEVVFLALDAQLGRLARAYLGQSVPIYGTSLLHAGFEPLARIDLNGVTFVDMPWLLLPDHPAVLSYAHPDTAQLPMEMQRFYALGIDAFRIALDLIRTDANLTGIDGVTGRISMDRDRRLVREPVAAQFVQGDTRVFEGVRP